MFRKIVFPTLILLLALFVFNTLSVAQTKTGLNMGIEIDCIFSLQGKITREKAKALKEFLKQCQADSNISTIGIDIQSLGGLAYPTFKICRLIQEIEKDKIVVTIGRGRVSSAAVAILVCGTPGYRFLKSGTVVVIHSSRNFVAKGHYTPEQLWDKYQEAKGIQTYYYELIADHSGQSPQQIAKDCYRKNFVLSDKKAINYGLVDYLIK